MENNRKIALFDFCETLANFQTADAYVKYVISKDYIKINKGDCGKYLVSWTKLTQASCTHDYNNTHVYATYLSGGYTKHVCTKCGHTYCDSYTPKSVLGTPGINSLYKTKKKKGEWMMADFEVILTDSLEKVLPNARPRPMADTRLTVFGGETVSFQLAARAMHDTVGSGEALTLRFLGPLADRVRRF